MGIQDYEWSEPFDRLLFVSEDRRLHVYSITHEFNKHILMFKETDKLPFVSRAAKRPRRICLTRKPRRSKKFSFYHVQKTRAQFVKGFIQRGVKQSISKELNRVSQSRAINVNLFTSDRFFSRKKMNSFPCHMTITGVDDSMSRGKIIQKANTSSILRAPRFCGRIALREIKLTSQRNCTTKWPSINILQE